MFRAYRVRNLGMIVKNPNWLDLVYIYIYILKRDSSSELTDGWINFLGRNDWKERKKDSRRGGEGWPTGGNRRADVRRAWIESIVGNREKYALIRACAGNLWICGKPDAYRQWPTSRDSCNHRLLLLLFVYG